MKKKSVTGGRMPVIIMTFVSLLLFWQSGGNVYASADKPAIEESGAAGSGMSEEIRAAGSGMPEEIRAADEEIPGKYEAPETVSGGDVGTPEMRLMKVFPLSSREIRQVPRYIVEGNAVYVLDESSIVVEETGRGSSEGADVVKVSKTVENLPDNDLERIGKTMVHEGITCDLLSIVYEVAERDKNGIPISYNAACEYGGLKKYGTSYPTAWQMTVWYDFYKAVGKESAATVQEEYEYIHVPAGRKAVLTEGTEGMESGETAAAWGEGEPLPEPAIKKFRIKPAPGEEEKERDGITDMAVPLAAAGTGIALPFIIWFAIVTAPLYAVKKEEKYRYIGRIRLKKEDGIYTAYLTKRLLARAEVPVFMIKLPGKVWRRTRAGMLQIHCPDGKRILLTAGKKASFTVEGD